MKLLYFARLREALGMSFEEVHPPQNVDSVARLAEWLRARGEPWTSELGTQQRWRAAVNQQLALPDSPLKEGDEVAFFPPVTGG